MRYAHYTDETAANYPVAILVPTIRKQEMADTYLRDSQVPERDILILDLHLTPGKKKPVIAEVKQYIEEELVPTLTDMGVEYVFCTQAEYFKTLTGARKIEPNLGYVLDSAYGDFKVIYLPNYRARFYDPSKFDKQMGQAFNALSTHRAGTYVPPGDSIIKFAAYPSTDLEVQEWLDKLLEMDCPLTIDTENFSLKHYDSGLGTISFAWNKHEGIAFAVDYVELPGGKNDEGHYGVCIENPWRRRMLRNFFLKLSQKAIYHSISYDVYILAYQLFMSDLLDTEGLLDGLEVMLTNWDCTKLITYLATNSCAGNKLSLKDQAQEFAGNYAQDDIKDIRRIPLSQLLEYNLADALATWYVHEKHHPTMIADDQQEIYETLFQPATVDIIQMQLTGMPVNMETVENVAAQLEVESARSVSAMLSNPKVGELVNSLNEKWVVKRNSELKVKRVSLADANEQFNPNSNPQLQELLYVICELPIIERTASGAPASDGDTLKSLQNHTKDTVILDLLSHLRDFKAVDKINSSFIPALRRAQKASDGWHYLFGNFNLGGTLSGRLSSSDPNLQNLPANSRYGKLIKSCFEAPPGWIFGGLDFSSLEDRISALQTKDPNKLKVYTDGYDGHSLRAYSYFQEQMPDIDPNSVESINSIETKHNPLRQESKAPTFALTYQGTVNTLMNNCGFTALMAQQIYGRYQEMYRISIEWVDKRLEQATIDGYVTVAFGLRVRTPLLKQVIRGTSKTPYEAEAEGRSAGNAMGQSWCMLNSRASSEFMGKVRKSKHRLNIRPSAHIHDAQYFMFRDDMDVIQYTNTHLVKAVEWQDHPEICHDKVKLGGELSLFYPTWREEIVIPNGATPDVIMGKIEEFLEAA